MSDTSHVQVQQVLEIAQDITTKADGRFRKLADSIVETDLGTDLASKINGKADAATSIAGYGITDAYTKSEVDNAIGQVTAGSYKPGGSLAAAGIVSSLLVIGNLGKVYNISEDFTTTADFVEGAGDVLPAGTNIVIVDADTTGQSPTYKFDVLAGAYGVATQSGNGLMSSTDKAKLDNADVTAYTGTGAVSVSNHEISVSDATQSASGLMSSTDKAKLDGADVTAYTGTGAVSVSNHEISVSNASTSADGLMSSTDKAKLDGADVTAYTGSGAVDITNHVVTVSDATTTDSGLMSSTDKAKLDGISTATAADIAAIKAAIWPAS